MPLGPARTVGSPRAQSTNPERRSVSLAQTSLSGAPPEPLVSRFQVSHGMLLNVLSRKGDGCRAMQRLLRGCHEPEARNVRHTHVDPSDDWRTWRLQQGLVDPALHNDWMAKWEVDLAASREANRPVLWLRGIGPIG